MGQQDSLRFNGTRLPQLAKSAALFAQDSIRNPLILEDPQRSNPPAFLLRIGRQVLPQVRPGVDPFSRMVGNDPKMKAIFGQIADVAPYDYPVHLSGATGTGKELAARAIHDQSPRRHGPFVAVNCGAIPEDLVESELFGHVKGAFSGAQRPRKGRFELAHRGTLFLDEVADLSPYIQVRLLRVLQSGSFEKVGGEGSFSVDVRIISAANHPLKAAMQQGRFRQDLYYRLNVVPIHLPPLKARCGDIALLARYFLDQAVASHRRCSMAISPEALAAMKRYAWPGNIRELQNAVCFAFVRAKGRTIDVCHLPDDIQRSVNTNGCGKRPGNLDAGSVTAALRATGGNKTRAAARLGVGRATLYRFLSLCGLDTDEITHD